MRPSRTTIVALSTGRRSVPSIRRAHVNDVVFDEACACSGVAPPCATIRLAATIAVPAANRRKRFMAD